MKGIETRKGNICLLLDGGEIAESVVKSVAVKRVDHPLLCCHKVPETVVERVAMETVGIKPLLGRVEVPEPVIESVAVETVCEPLLGRHEITESVVECVAVEAVGEPLFRCHKVAEAIVERVTMEAIESIAHSLVNGNPFVNRDPLVDRDPLVENVSRCSVHVGKPLARVKVPETVIEGVRVEAVCRHLGVALVELAKGCGRDQPPISDMRKKKEKSQAKRRTERAGWGKMAPSHRARKRILKIPSRKIRLSRKKVG